MQPPIHAAISCMLYWLVAGTVPEMAFWGRDVGDEWPEGAIAHPDFGRVEHGGSSGGGQQHYYKLTHPNLGSFLRPCGGSTKEAFSI